MSYLALIQAAVKWSLAQIGCQYSQAKRTQSKIFDCSSLVARAYSAQGKQWKYGGAVPTSMYEVYDDDFELLWPETYAEIGNRFGGSSVINLAKQPGDLQFICTNFGTSRSNKITHVAMVADAKTIVHARGTKYGVCTNSISLYSGKICAVVRYNPSCPLRKGMCGWRTSALQKALNAKGADLSADGEFGERTQDAVSAFQRSHGFPATGIADAATLAVLMDASPENDRPLEPGNYVQVTGDMVNIRLGPGTEFDSVFVVNRGDLLREVISDNWIPVEYHNGIYWISEKYATRQNAST